MRQIAFDAVVGLVICGNRFPVRLTAIDGCCCHFYMFTLNSSETDSS